MYKHVSEAHNLYGPARVAATQKPSVPLSCHCGGYRFAYRGYGERKSIMRMKPDMPVANPAIHNKFDCHYRNRDKYPFPHCGFYSKLIL